MSHDRSHDVSVIGFDVGGREHADLALELAAPPDVVLLGYDGEHVSLTQRQLLVALRLIVVEHNHLGGRGVRMSIHVHAPGYGAEICTILLPYYTYIIHSP